MLATREKQSGLVAQRRAVANLLRWADSDLRDAKHLIGAGSLRNAPPLLRSSVSGVVDAVLASEHGWPGKAGDLRLVPDANPAKQRLAGLQSGLALLQQAASSALRADGSAPPPPDRPSVREAAAGLSALVADLAAQFAVDLDGDGPAGNATPIRPEPAIEPPIVPPPAPRPAPALRLASSVPAPHPVPPSSVIQPPAPTGSVASTVFWSLMDRWAVPDEDALALLGHPGGLTKKGTRPRFKLTAAEAATVRRLQAIDAALASLAIAPRDWLRKKARAVPFAGATPLAFMTRAGEAGQREVSRTLLQQGLRSSVDKR